MTIKEVSYRRLVSYGNYENAAIEARAVVDEGDEPSMVLIHLKGWVERQLDALTTSADKVADLDDRQRQLRFTIQEKEHELAKLNSRWEKAKAFLATHGITVEENLDDIPF